MKSKLSITVIVILATILSASIVGVVAKDTAAVSEAKGLKVGTVSVRKIFQDCRRIIKSQQEVAAERDKMEAELEKLSAEIDRDKAGMRILKPGSVDYSNLMRELLEKQGRLQAQQEFFKRQISLRGQAVMEGIFKDIVKATAAVAKSKGFDLVLEKSEPELPASSPDELTLAISSHKVLYSAGCEDITDAVLAKVDANSP